MTNKKVVISVILLIALGLFSVLALSNFSNQTENSQETDDTSISISTSIYPWYLITKELIAGDSPSLINPPNSDPHDYEPTAKDLLDITESNLFIYNGAEFDSWVEGIEFGETQTINLANFVELIDSKDDSHEDEDHKDEDHKDEEKHADDEEPKTGTESEDEKEEHGHAEDPHFWLSPSRVKKSVEAITAKLIEIDPENTSTYQQKQNAFISDLDSLEMDYRNTLSTCTENKIFTSHEAFGYLGNDYNFEIETLAGLEPSDIKPASEINQIIEEIKADGIEYILIEPNLDRTITDTVVAETGVQLLDIYNLESGDLDANYIDIMRNNLNNLKTALKCS